MKYIIYALVSNVDDRIYVGFTQDIQRRLKEHNSGFVRSTKAYKPWTVFYTETLSSRTGAREREKQLKSGYGKEFLKSVRDQNNPG